SERSDSSSSAGTRTARRGCSRFNAPLIGGGRRVSRPGRKVPTGGMPPVGGPGQTFQLEGGAMFQLTSDLLERLCAINHFPVPTGGMVFFGLRGCLPAAPDDHAFAAERRLVATPVDYTTPRCTLGQWLPAEGRVAVYPGSTVLRAIVKCCGSRVIRRRPSA